LSSAFDFDVKADALYKLLMPRLPVTLATEFRQVGQTNGFELYRRLVQKLDPPRADASFHLSNEIRGLGAGNLCKDFAHTVNFVKFLDTRMEEYQTETGETFSDSDAARVLSQAIDDATMGLVQDDGELDLKDSREGKAYAPVRAWILARDVKLKLRKHTRVRPATKGPDDMVYGVDVAQPQPLPGQAPPQTAPAAEDPWHASIAAPDPWATSSAAPPGEPSAAAWAPQPEWQGGDLDAFGKGKGNKGGKDQARAPLECYNCLGKGHPQRLCATPPGMGGKPGASACEVCHGKGHSKSQCTSKGGGQWTDPALSQKGKGAGSWNQQTAKGKGKGKYGAQGLGKGKGQGKFNSFDDGFAPPGFEQQWQPNWQQQWQPEAAQQSQFPWMAAAAPVQPTGDPWSQWGGQQQQQWPGAGGFHSLTPGPRQIS
jgi:hypothetical protein